MSMFPGNLMAIASKPTYGELIDLFEEVKHRSPNDEHLLVSEFVKKFPNIPIGRPRRFYETISRLVAPTQPSAIGDPKLIGSPLATYRKRTWEPRIRNTLKSGEYILVFSYR